MNALDIFYEKPFVSNMVFLMKKLFYIIKAETDSVDYLNKFNMIINSLPSFKLEYDDENIVLIFLFL